MGDITHEGTFESKLGNAYFEFNYCPERPEEVNIASDLCAHGNDDVSVTVPLGELEIFLEKVRKAKA